ncbi:unnamed protein product [Caenorhabditis auriculariae]|uniref:Uncharacterized protein n=1 Tax=Caenorhabditis auriculariae TaxID=2777116 RepID=A0A8S1GU92_9PELO|nr:unnamed protein product [Caenorhabditis auriculariae]
MRLLVYASMICFINCSIDHAVPSFKRGPVELFDETALTNPESFDYDFNEDLKKSADNEDLYDQFIAQLPMYNLYKLGQNKGLTKLGHLVHSFYFGTREGFPTVFHNAHAKPKQENSSHNDESPNHAKRSNNVYFYFKVNHKFHNDFYPNYYHNVHIITSTFHHDPTSNNRNSNHHLDYVHFLVLLDILLNLGLPSGQILTEMKGSQIADLFGGKGLLFLIKLHRRELLPKRRIGTGPRLQQFLKLLQQIFL